jgi:DNA invertase Pin-like site-specific DNA recombinase
MKAIILARVSTKEQEEGHSIGAQKQRIEDYCIRKDLSVIKTFEIIESSTKGERKAFKAMLEYAKSQKETIAPRPTPQNHPLVDGVKPPT